MVKAKMQMIGDWANGVRVPLRDAMSIGVDEAGKGGAKACRRALVFMAESARKITPKAKKNRPIRRDAPEAARAATKSGARSWDYVLLRLRGAEGGSKDVRLFRWMFSERAIAEGRGMTQFAASFNDARRIGNAGLARRSWMWGLGKLKKTADPRPPIAGVAELETLIGRNEGGYQLTNRLSYLGDILPAGWESEVEARTISRIFAIEANKILRSMGTNMKEVGRAAGVKGSANIYRHFLQTQGGAM